MVGTQIIFALVVALEEGQYKLVQVFDNRQECRILEKQQTVLAKCFKITINQNTDLKETVDTINKVIQ